MPPAPTLSAAPITQDVLTIPRKLPEGGRVNLVGLTREQLTRLARNSFEGSFLSEADKAKRIAEVEAYAAAQA